METKFGGRTLLGFLVLIFFGQLCAAKDDISFSQFNEYIYKGEKDLECYVCNSKVGGCDPHDANVKFKCKASFLEEVYGEKLSAESPVMSLKKWPLSLSEMPDVIRGEEDVGWDSGLSSPKSYKNRKSLHDATSGSRFSSFGNVAQEGRHEEKRNLQISKGFQSCVQMKITVNGQDNGGHKIEIPSDTPRIIRGCSFVNPADKKGHEGFADDDTKTCRKINYKSSVVEVCYCSENLCNSSTVLQVSIWMMVSSLVLVFTKMF